MTEPVTVQHIGKAVRVPLHSGGVSYSREIRLSDGRFASVNAIGQRNLPECRVGDEWPLKEKP